MTSVYWDRVVAASVEEIRQGRTPKTDVLCNSRVKFAAFMDHLAGLQRNGGGGGSGGMRFDRVASGHYVRVVQAAAHPGSGSGGNGGGEGGEQRANLCLTPDVVKDQTYFLAHLSQEQLARAMFLLGGLTKAQAGLAAAARKDSQGFCFLGKVKCG